MKFSLSEGAISKKTQCFLRIQCCKFCLFSSYNKVLTASHSFYLYLLLLIQSTVFQINRFQQDELNPPFLNYNNCISLHYLPRQFQMVSTLFSWFELLSCWFSLLPTLTYIHISVSSWPLLFLGMWLTSAITDALGNHSLFLST